MTQPLYEKHRPKSFADVVGQDKVVKRHRPSAIVADLVVGFLDKRTERSR